MSEFTCEKCGTIFTNKSSFTRHVNKKKSCITRPETSFVVLKPILKWVGGKTQIIDMLLSVFPNPKEINNYHEIFLGGGSVLFALLYFIKFRNISLNGNIYAYDLNEPLICTYKNIQTSPFELFDEIQVLIQDLMECKKNGIVNRKPKTLEEAKERDENYYYWIRMRYNNLTTEEKNSVLGSAMFIFLNKTCFRGLFRIGPNGFNVPFGNYKNPKIIDKEHLLEIHELIKEVHFECCDFTQSINDNIIPGDFVYCDPPYAPETSTSFVGYTENGFPIDKHIELFNKIHSLTENNVKMLMNNSDVPLVRENFVNEKYTIKTIECRRSINSKKPQSTTNEVFIKNY
jgi:DNA adenine methylase